jgi:hypothetical protein
MRTQSFPKHGENRLIAYCYFKEKDGTSEKYFLVKDMFDVLGLPLHLLNMQSGFEKSLPRARSSCPTQYKDFSLLTCSNVKESKRKECVMGFGKNFSLIPVLTIEYGRHFTPKTYWNIRWVSLSGDTLGYWFSFFCAIYATVFRA